MYLTSYPKLKNNTLEQMVGVEERLDEYVELANTFPDVDIPVYNDIKDHILKLERGYVQTITKEVGYWRKANAIHRWFVDHVQGGVDECDDYEINARDIKLLFETCKTVLDNKDDESIAKRFLPTTGGFFFGGTEYDNDYYQDVKYTFDLLTKVLDTFDFETNYLVYQSSW